MADRTGAVTGGMYVLYRAREGVLWLRTEAVDGAFALVFSSRLRRAGFESNVCGASAAVHSAVQQDGDWERLALALEKSPSCRCFAGIVRVTLPLA